MTPRRYEAWLLDLSIAAKIRPVLVVSTQFKDLDRALVTVTPHITRLRGSRHEIAVDASFLKPGPFRVQGVATYPVVRAIRKLDTLKTNDFEVVFAGLLRWLGRE